MREVTDILQEIKDNIHQVMVEVDKKVTETIESPGYLGVNLALGQLWSNIGNSIKQLNEYQNLSKSISDLISHETSTKIHAKHLLMYSYNHARNKLLGEKSAAINSTQISEIPLDIEISECKTYNLFKKVLQNIEANVAISVGYTEDYFTQKLSLTNLTNLYKAGKVPEGESYLSSNKNYGVDALYMIYFICNYEIKRLAEIEKLERTKKLKEKRALNIKVGDKKEEEIFYEYELVDKKPINAILPYIHTDNTQYFSQSPIFNQSYQSMISNFGEPLNNKTQIEKQLDLVIAQSSPYANFIHENPYLKNISKAVLVTLAATFVLGTMLGCAWFVTPFVGGVYSFSVVMFTSYLAYKTVVEGFRWLDQNQAKFIQKDALEKTSSFNLVNSAFEITPTLKTTKKIIDRVKTAISSAIVLSAAGLIVGTMAVCALFISTTIGVIFSVALIAFSAYLAVSSTLDLVPMCMNADTSLITDKLAGLIIQQKDKNISEYVKEAVGLELIKHRQVIQGGNDDRANYKGLVDYAVELLKNKKSLIGSYYKSWGELSQVSRSGLLLFRSHRSAQFVKGLMDGETEDLRTAKAIAYLKDTKSHGSNTKEELMRSIFHDKMETLSLGEEDKDMYQSFINAKDN